MIFVMDTELIGAVGQHLNQGRKMHAVKELRTRTRNLPFRPHLFACKILVEAIQAGAIEPRAKVEEPCIADVWYVHI